MSIQTLPASPAFTTGEIAGQLGQPLHKVFYAIRSRRIQPVLRAGTFRLYGSEQIEQIAAALREIEARRAPVVAAGQA